MAEARTARVKWFNDEKGWGFLETPAGDVFVHHSTIQMNGHRSLHQGDMVQYEAEAGEKGLFATLCIPISRP